MEEQTCSRPATPCISVIVPAFERAHLLPRSIGSVLAQTCSDWELLVVDDGSTDNTAQVVRDWGRKTARIRYLHQANRGVGAARNLGIQYARGHYIACLDSDDEYFPKHLETRLSLLRRHALDLVQGGVRVLGKDRTVDFFDPQRLVRLSDCVIGGTLFGKREVFVALGGFGALTYGEDLDLWLRARRRFKVATFRNPTTYCLHETPDSLRLTRYGEWADRQQA